MRSPLAATGAPRPAAVAGRFYPDDPARLAATVDALLAAAAAPPGPPAKALIAPHAGYPYSGPVAASAYARVGGDGGDAVTRVVLLGPAHRWPVPGLALPSARAFDTPLGRVPVDAAAAAALAEVEGVHVVDEAHVAEHALEVQLPFLQRRLPAGFTLVPLLVGQARPALVEAVLERLWGGPETLIVVSSDLSHFHDYATARRLDAATSAAIEALHPGDIDEQGACGRVPIQGLLAVAAGRGLRATAVDLRSSGDTAGDRDRVVGYGAYVLC